MNLTGYPDDIELYVILPYIGCFMCGDLAVKVDPDGTVCINDIAYCLPCHVDQIVRQTDATNTMRIM
jgi:hypothetical protein